MHRTIRRTAALLALAALPALSACSKGAADEAVKIQPATVIKIDGTDLQRVVLTARAADRLGITTTPLVAGSHGGQARTVVPYAAVIYDPQGAAFVYTSPEPLTFVRHAVTVEVIDGDSVYLSDGPPAGTAVVTVGTAELFGTETGIGEFE
jgi:hypothetical protein